MKNEKSNESKWYEKYTGSGKKTSKISEEKNKRKEFNN